VWRFRDDLDDDVVAELTELCQREPSGVDTGEFDVNAAPYVAVLSRRGPVKSRWSGPSYRFGVFGRISNDTVRVNGGNADLLYPHFEDWYGEIEDRQPFLALVEDGHAVAICRSVRITPDAHEAGVETATAYRRRGCAARLVPEWAQEVAGLKAIPLYSTSWRNVASRNLAGALGLIQYGSVVQLT
jgi:hypothetical protein